MSHLIPEPGVGLLQLASVVVLASLGAEQALKRMLAPPTSPVRRTLWLHGPSFIKYFPHTVTSVTQNKYVSVEQLSAD